MLVTSDIYDLKNGGVLSGFEWREHLLCGIAYHGVGNANVAGGARLLLEAAERRGLMGEMRWANYSKSGSGRENQIAPKSMTKLAEGRLSGAHDAVAVLLRGTREAVGAQNDRILFGGVFHCGYGLDALADEAARSAPRPFFDGDFLFPLTSSPLDDAAELLRMAAEDLGAEYGYLFIRDDFCFPSAFAWGIGSRIDFTRMQVLDDEDIGAWRHHARTNRLWAEPWPVLRDLYELNLISERHTAKPIGDIGYLLDWIGGAPGRGTLESLGGGRFLWRLTSAEIYDVRPTLHAAGALFSCPERVYRDLGGLHTDAILPRPGWRYGDWWPKSV